MMIKMNDYYNIDELILTEFWFFGLKYVSRFYINYSRKLPWCLLPNRWGIKAHGGVR